MRVILIVLMFAALACQASAMSLNEILGFKPAAKLLIVNADDAGNSHSANLAIMDMFDKGALTSSTIMVPCPWVPEIFEYAKTRGDFGVHLTHTSEWKNYKWRPLTSGAGLADPAGYLWPEEPDVYAHSTPQAAYVEAKAQIERALAAGVDVTHIDSHMGAMQLNPDFLMKYLALAAEYRVPLRMAPAEMLTDPAFKPAADKARALGVLFPDDLVWDGVPRWARQPVEQHDDYWRRVLRSLRPGVTEIYIHPAVASDEMKAITGSWAERDADHRFFTGAEFREIVKEQGITLVGYRAVRAAQRALPPR